MLLPFAALPSTHDRYDRDRSFFKESSLVALSAVEEQLRQQKQLSVRTGAFEMKCGVGSTTCLAGPLQYDPYMLKVRPRSYDPGTLNSSMDPYAFRYNVQAHFPTAQATLRRLRKWDKTATYT